MLRKKSSGDRVIGLLSMVARVWGLAREPLVKTWAAESEPGWGAAVSGHVALRDAFMRVAEEE
eukprot:6272579-Pyramimonas_sp.AAC.1